ncbi:MAG: MBOAT family protein [Lachnospiraceae bacterium]|nr:MBOAT family protein [Lachnospiraceae bacterium]
MLFSSISFLYYFLPITLLLHFIVPAGKAHALRYKNLVLLIASFVFYFWGEPKFCLLMAISICIAYVSGRLLSYTTEKKPAFRKPVFLLSVTIILLFLFIFKYFDFFIQTINQVTGSAFSLLRLALPLGISFYTFQIISYQIDVYNGKISAERSLLDFAMYISFFPQLVAGPIVRYETLQSEVKRRTCTVTQIGVGCQRFLIGLSKKLILADAYGQLIKQLQAHGSICTGEAWLIAIAFTLQIYFDFSGYSDMAIGLGHMFGFHFPENFDYPYMSKSITEFWRRWHMTLGGFFRDYVYIPLGGNRVPFIRWTFNVFIVWGLSGFWHGAGFNFILWGLFYGLLLWFEKLALGKLLKKLPAFLQHGYVILLTVLGFVIFRAESLNELGGLLKSMFSIPLSPKSVYHEFTLYYLKSYLPLLLLGVFGCTSLPKKAWYYLYEKAFRDTHTRLTLFWQKAMALIELLIPFILLFLCTSYLISGSYQTFLYFRF